MRIFVGLTDVANVAATYADGFKQLGHEVFSVVWNRSYFYPDSNYSLIIDERQPGSGRRSQIGSYLGIMSRMTRLITALRCELFVLFAPAVLPTQLYYPILKNIGRKIITVYWGSDIRYWYAFGQEMESLGVEKEVAPFFEYARKRSGGSYWDKLRTVRVAEKYSDLILSQPDCAQLQVRPYMRANLPLDISKYRFRIPGRTKPLILHAPSVPEAKGTDVVLRVIQELRSEGLDFDFRLIEKMPNADLRELLTESDIVIDELYSATVGGLSAEAMACGNVVLVRYMAEFSKVPPGCPALNVNIFTLKDNLREVITNINYRKELAGRGRPYVESSNDHVRICRNLLRWLDNKEHLVYDFEPTYFNNLRMPENILKDERDETRNRRYDFFKTLINTGTTRKK